jgi:hypothetical protein
MSRLKYDDPCHCGSGKRYRECHLQADREEGARPIAEAPKAAAPADTPRPAWHRTAAGIVGVIALIAGVLVMQEFGPEAGVSVMIAGGLLIGAIYVFGKPPPPDPNSKDPAAIDFGR